MTSIQGKAIFERHFSIRTLSEMWGYSEDKLHAIFEQEMVLRMGVGSKDSPRIPESVAERVYQKYTKKRA